MLVPNRHASSPAYRYGFQGQEKDDELKGEGNSLNYTFRMHDPRVGRFFATDPLEKKYPWYTPYQFSGNKVIAFRELEGLEETFAIKDNQIVYAGPAVNYYTSYEAAEKALQEMQQKHNDYDGPTITQDNRTAEERERQRKSAQWQKVENDRQKLLFANPTNIISHGVAVGVPEIALDIATEGAFSYVKNTRIFKTIANSKLALKTAGTFNGALNGTYKIIESSPLNQKIQIRKTLAKSWGLQTDYVNFDEKVYTETLEEGTVLIQYRLKGYEGTKGVYYALPGTSPEQIGLRLDDIGETYMVTTKGSQKVIFSTHQKNLAPYYDKFGNPVEGGGLQIKSDVLNYETNSSFKKIDNPK
ncbi:hypothetical protein GFJ99_11120 [Flavobacterium sp. LMO6]|nr:hypothetical protein [Flavobacterium sp. LMO6]